MNELLKNISWIQYLSVASALIIIYYLAVALLYYRAKLIRAFKGRQLPDPYSDEQVDDDSPDQHTGELTEELENTVEDIAHRILVAGNMATKQELLVQLKARVADFGGLSRPAYRYALNHFITGKAKENCGVDFSEEELEEAWDSLPR